MASLKSFLFGLAPIIGMTGAALYERQRALVNLGALEAAPGRGPGSGVPVTADNIAAVIISVLAAETLSQVDETVAALCDATPRALRNERAFREKWHGKRKPTFKTELGRALSRQPLAYDESAEFISSISVTRPWRGRIVSGMPLEVGGGAETEIFEFVSEYKAIRSRLMEPIQVTAAFEFDILLKIGDLTCFSLAAKEGEEE